MLPITERILAPGVTLRAVQTKKFKTSVLSASFLVPLRAETASLDAVLPEVLRRGTQAHPDMESFSAVLDDLYGGTLEAIVRKKGECLAVGFWGSFLDDAFVPEPSHILEDAAALLGEVLLRPAGEEGAFVPAYVTGERDNLVDRIRRRVNDKRGYALSRLREQMCAGEPFGVSGLGTEETARAIDGAALAAHYREILRTAPLNLYYCGSAEPDRVEAALRTALAALPQTDRDPIPATTAPERPAGPVRTFEDRMDVGQGKLALGFRTGGAFRGKDAIARAMLLNAVYGGSTTSKLFMNVREKLSLCYFANSSVTMSKGVLFVSSGVDFANFARAEEEILAQLAACRAGAIDAEELESARRYVLNSIRSNLDAQGRLEEYWLSRAVSGTAFPPEELADAVARVRRDEVVQAAQGVALDSVYRLLGKEA